MQTSTALQMTKAPSNKARIAGWVLSILCILFLLFDSVMKFIMDSRSIEGTIRLGWPVSVVPILGIVLLGCTILYAIPRTAVLGAILLTAYLGGATATMVRIGEPFLFSVVFGIFVWAGLYLREPKLRELMPVQKAVSDK